MPFMQRAEGSKHIQVLVTSGRAAALFEDQILTASAWSPIKLYEELHISKDHESFQC